MGKEQCSTRILSFMLILNLVILHMFKLGRSQRGRQFLRIHSISIEIRILLSTLIAKSKSDFLGTWLRLLAVISDFLELHIDEDLPFE